MMIKSIPAGKYILQIPIEIEEGRPDLDGDIELDSRYPVHDYWSFAELLEVIDPKQLKELRENRKQELLQELAELEKIEGDV